MTTITFSNYKESVTEDAKYNVHQDGKLIASRMSERVLTSIDWEIAQACYVAKQTGDAVPVPTFAKVPKPRNSRVHAIRL